MSKVPLLETLEAPVRWTAPALQAMVPWLLMLRSPRYLVPPFRLSVMPGSICRVLPPVSSPPLQVELPVRVTAPAPVKLPPERVSDGRLRLSLAVKLPAETLSGVAQFTVPVVETLAPVTDTVPLPVKAAPVVRL